MKSKDYATEEERWQALRIEGQEAAAPDDWEPTDEDNAAAEVTEDGEQ